MTMHEKSSSQYAELAEKADGIAEDAADLITYFTTNHQQCHSSRTMARLDDALYELNVYLAKVGACAEHVRLIALNARALTVLKEIENQHDEPEHVDGVMPGKENTGE